MAVELTGDAVSYADGDALIARRGAGTGTPVNVAPVGEAWGAAAREALKLLTGADRLPATAVRDLPVYREPIWGAGAPGPDDGKDGDTYIDGANSAIYGPKAAGVWPAPLSFSGDGGGIAEAPNDGGAYARENGGWVEIGATLAALQASLAGKAAVDHEHPVAAAPEGRLLVSEASDEATFRPPSEVWPLLLPEVPVANFSPGLILGSDTDGGLIELTPEQVHARAPRVIEGGAAGLDASGSIDLTWTPGLGGWRRRAVGNITLTGFPGLSESSGKQRFVFRQDATGARALTIGPEIILKNDADVSLDAGEETGFDVFAMGSKVYIERVTPIVASSWTHTLSIVDSGSGPVGQGNGFGDMSPSTFGGLAIDFFYALPTAPRMAMKLAGGAQPHTAISVEFEGLGTYSFGQLTSGRYGLAGTEPPASTVSDWIMARVGQNVRLRMVAT